MVIMSFGELGYSRYHQMLHTNPDYGYLITQRRVITQSGSYPHQAANDLVNIALGRNAGGLTAAQRVDLPNWTRLLSLEHDHNFPIDVFQKHARYQEDIVAGLYVLRDENDPWPVMYNWDKATHTSAERVPPQDLAVMFAERGLYKVDVVPMGCTSFSREMLENWPADQPFFSSGANPLGKTVSHDVFFCRTAQKNGYQPWIDTSLRVKHYVLVEIDDDYFIKWFNSVGAQKVEARQKDGWPIIIVAHTEGGLHPETEAALKESRLEYALAPVRADEDYFNYIEAAWNSGASFMTVEQDIVPPPGHLREMMECPEPWCSSPYEYPPYGLYAGMGCAKFSKELIAQFPDAMKTISTLANDRHPPKHWCSMDGLLKDYLLQGRGGKWPEDGPHIHPEVTHHHKGRPAHDCLVGLEDEVPMMRMHL